LGRPDGSCSGIVLSIIKLGNKTPTLYPFQIVKRIHPLNLTGINSHATLNEVISKIPAKKPFINSTITIILYSQNKDIDKFQKNVKIKENFKTNILPNKLVKNQIKKFVTNLERQKPIPMKEIWLLVKSNFFLKPSIKEQYDVVKYPFKIKHKNALKIILLTSHPYP
jgi:hypothetical protein